VGVRSAADRTPTRSAGYKFRQGSDLHFLHHPVAMGLDGTFSPADRVGNLLVCIAANDKQKDFTFARRKLRLAWVP
jgi:hypothetical protein